MSIEGMKPTRYATLRIAMVQGILTSRLTSIT